MLLLGCFALFWSLYYTLEVMMAHVDFRVLLCLPRRQGGHRRGRQGKGVEEALIGDEEQDSGVELQAVLDSDVKEPLASGEWLAT